LITEAIFLPGGGVWCFIQSALLWSRWPYLYREQKKR